MFYRLNDQNNAEIYNDDGSRVTKIDANVYPINSSLSTKYEHAEGITLSVADAESIGIEKE